MPNYIAYLPKYIQQTKLFRGWKVPKFIKFVNDTNESTLGHMARFQTEAAEITNNECLKMKYFPSSLKKRFYLFHNSPSFYTSLEPIRKSFPWAVLYGPVEDKS